MFVCSCLFCLFICSCSFALGLFLSVSGTCLDVYPCACCPLLVSCSPLDRSVGLLNVFGWPFFFLMAQQNPPPTPPHLATVRPSKQDTLFLITPPPPRRVCLFIRPKSSHHITSSHGTQLCVPDWGFYNKHPVKWLDSVPDRKGEKKNATTSTTGKTGGK